MVPKETSSPTDGGTGAERRACVPRFFRGDGRWAVVVRTHAWLTNVQSAICTRTVSTARPRSTQPPHTGTCDRRHRQPARHSARPARSAVPGASLLFRSRSSARSFTEVTNAEGIFRLRDLPPGAYELQVNREGIAPLVIPEFQLQKTGLVVLELKVQLLEDTNGESQGPIGRARISTHAACTGRSWKRLSRRSRPSFRDTSDLVGRRSSPFPRSQF